MLKKKQAQKLTKRQYFWFIEASAVSIMRGSIKKIEEDKSGWLAFLIQKILGTYFVSSSQGLHGDVELMNGFADDL